MIEIPESKIISRQAAGILTGRTIAGVINATSPHKFAFFNGDPAGYPALLSGRRIETINGYGAVQYRLSLLVHRYLKNLELVSKFILRQKLIN